MLELVSGTGEVGWERIGNKKHQNSQRSRKNTKHQERSFRSKNVVRQKFQSFHRKTWFSPKRLKNIDKEVQGIL